MSITAYPSEKIKTKTTFMQKCFNKTATSADYFKEIAYEVDLTSLYNVVDTCYYNNDMKYAPILLELSAEELILENNNCKYILQVWDQSGTKVYQRSLNNKIKLWAICYSHLIYVPVGEDENANQVHIVDLDHNDALLLVENFANNDDVQFISFNPTSLLLCSATENTIEFLILPGNVVDNKDTTIDANSLVRRKVEEDLKIWGLLVSNSALKAGQIVVVFETSDNQLDFNKLTVLDIEDAENGFKYRQCREVVQRDKIQFIYDPIVKAEFVFSHGVNYSVALRKSGNFDLYSNMQRKDKPNDAYAQDVSLTIKGFYFKMVDGDIMYFLHGNAPNIEFSMADEDTDDSVNFEKLYINRVDEIVNIYKSFQLVRIKNTTTTLVVHGSFISQYDLVDQSWDRHVKYPAEITQLFRLQTSNGISSAVLLSNSEIYLDVPTRFGPEVSSNDVTYKFDGEILDSYQDTRDHTYFYMITKENDGGVKLKILYENILQNIDEVTDLTEDAKVISVQHKGEGNYIIVQDGTYLGFFQTQIKEQKDKKGKVLTRKIVCTLIDEYDQVPEITGTIHSAAGYDFKKNYFLFDKQNIYVMKIKDKTCTVYKDQNVFGIQNFSKQVTYGICAESKDGRFSSGLRVFDLESIVKTDRCVGTPLKSIDVGCNGDFEYSESVQRVAYLNSLTNIVVVPLLHDNSTRFIGMDDPNEYLCYRIYQDKVVFLNKKNKLQTWNLANGKVQPSYKLPDQDFTEFDVYSEDRKKLSLLRSKYDIQDYKEQDFYQPWQLQQNLTNQSTYVQSDEEKRIKQWKLIEIVSDQSVKEHYTFLHPSYTYQKLYISSTREYMIEALDNWRAFLYRAIPETSDENGSTYIKWEMVKRIQSYPQELDVNPTYLPFYSPDFSLNMDINKERKVFIIKDTFTDQERFEVPIDLMKYDKKEKTQSVINRFQWIDNRVLKILSKDGIEKTVDIEDNFKEIEFNKVPLLDVSEWKNNMFYFEKPVLANEQIQERLVRKYQSYKSAYFLDNKRSAQDLYKILISVDPEKIDYADQSFTFMHWSIVEQLLDGYIKFTDLEEGLIEPMIYNIFPGGDTLLHKLCEKEDALVKLLKMAHPKVDGEMTIKFYVPILPNMELKTPLHILRDKKDYKNLDNFVKYLKVYDLDHHSRAIKDLIPVFIRKGLINFTSYLDSRIQQNEQSSLITKGSLKEEGGTIIASQLWFKKQDFDQEVIAEKIVKPIEGNPGQVKVTSAVESKIKCEFIDLPGIYHYNDSNFVEFIDELATTDQYDLFTQRAIQSILEFNFPLVREFIVKKLFIPFAVFLATYEVYINIIFEHREHNGFGLLVDRVFLAALAGFATYFLVNEGVQIKESGLAYFQSFWNFVDLVPNLGIYVFVVVQLFEIGEEENIALIRTVQAVTTIFMWFKFLYFLRIYKNLGYLINMISMVIIDMRWFFLVLFVTISAFGQAFLSLSLANEPGDDQFVKNLPDAIVFAYRMILGDFDTSGFGQVSVLLMWILFLIMTLVVMVVMLNLLIAIISETFGKVTSNAESAQFQEIAIMISDNLYLVPQSRILEYAEQDKFLLVVTDLESQSNEFSDPIVESITEIKEAMDIQIKDLKTSIQSVDKLQTTIESRFKAMDKASVAQDKKLQLLLSANSENILNEVKRAIRREMGKERDDE